MNMKKTIAAVAACAMAVSAMATTVSAVDENATEAKSLHYDLTVKETIHTATLTFTAKSAKVSDTVGIAITVPKYVTALADKVNVAVADKSTKTAYTFEFNSNSGAAGYDGTAAQYDLDGDKKNDVYVIDFGKVNGTAIQKAFQNSEALDITVTMADVPVTADQATVNGDLTSDTPTIKAELLSAVNYNATSKIYSPVGATTTPSVATTSTDLKNGKLNGAAAVKNIDVKKPMKTTANTTTGTYDIITRLGEKNTLNNYGGSYKNVKAVLNDMVANYDDVVFTFNTATTKVIEDGLYAGMYNSGLPGVEDWKGTDCTSFPQHLYNKFGDEGSGFTYSDSYVFNNLFNAALIANNNYTMNQSSVTPFEYSKTSVSFSWSDMTGGNSFVSVASAIDSLQLATSSTWYWDSMDVKGYVLAADDASTDAGIEDEGDDLDDADADADADADDDTVADDDVAADDDVDADVDADDDVAADDDAAADDTVADDTTDANPATGNAPIALAVIPVALAAAAVVAKKRG